MLANTVLTEPVAANESISAFLTDSVVNLQLLHSSKQLLCLMIFAYQQHLCCACFMFADSDKVRHIAAQIAENLVG
jgi:hypothetical protein